MRIIGEVEAPNKKFENKSATESLALMHKSSIDQPVEIPSTHNMVVAGPLTITSSGELTISGHLVLV